MSHSSSLDLHSMIPKARLFYSLSMLISLGQRVQWAFWTTVSPTSTARRNICGKLLEDDLGVPLDHLSPSSFHSLSLCRMISSWISSIYRSLLSRCSLLFGALFDPYKYSHSRRARERLARTTEAGRSDVDRIHPSSRSSFLSLHLSHGDPGYLLRVETFGEERAAIDRIEQNLLHRQHRRRIERTLSPSIDTKHRIEQRLRRHEDQSSLSTGTIDTNIASNIIFVGTKNHRRYRLEPNETKHRIEDPRRHEDQSSLPNGTIDTNIASNIIFVGTKINRRYRMEPPKRNIASNIIFVGTKNHRRYRLEPNETKHRIEDPRRHEDQSSLPNGTIVRTSHRTSSSSARINRRHRLEPNETKHRIEGPRRHEDQSSLPNGTIDTNIASNIIFVGTKINRRYEWNHRNETSHRTSSSSARRTTVVIDWNQTKRNIESSSSARRSTVVID